MILINKKNKKASFKLQATGAIMLPQLNVINKTERKNKYEYKK